MIEITTKMIRYVRAWRCALVNFFVVFPFVIFSSSLLNFCHAPWRPTLWLLPTLRTPHHGQPFQPARVRAVLTHKNSPSLT
jgi:hypothetical protein